jgi:hypothetical protein
MSEHDKHCLDAQKQEIGRQSHYPHQAQPPQKTKRPHSRHFLTPPTFSFFPSVAFSKKTYARNPPITPQPLLLKS